MYGDHCGEKVIQMTLKTEYDAEAVSLVLKRLHREQQVQSGAVPRISQNRPTDRPKETNPKRPTKQAPTPILLPLQAEEIIKPWKDQKGQRFVLRAIETQEAGSNQLAIVINQPFESRELDTPLEEAGPIRITEYHEEHQTDPLTFVRIQFPNNISKQRGLEIIRKLEDNQRLLEDNTQLVDIRVPCGQNFAQVYNNLVIYGDLIWLRF